MPMAMFGGPRLLALAVAGLLVLPLALSTGVVERPPPRPPGCVPRSVDEVQVDPSCVAPPFIGGPTDPVVRSGEIRALQDGDYFGLGDLVVESGGRLVMWNATLTFVRPSNVTLLDGASLEVRGGSVLDTLDIVGPPDYRIVAQPGSSLRITDSIVRGTAAVRVLTDSIDIQRARFEESDVGLDLQGVDAALEGVAFARNVIGVLATGGSLELRDSHLDGNQVGVRAIDSDLTLVGNEIIAGVIGVEVSGGSSVMTANTFAEHRRPGSVGALVGSGATTTLSRNAFTNWACAVCADASELEVADNVFSALPATGPDETSDTIGVRSTGASSSALVTNNSFTGVATGIDVARGMIEENRLWWANTTSIRGDRVDVINNTIERAAGSWLGAAILLTGPSNMTGNWIANQSTALRSYDNVTSTENVVYRSGLGYVIESGSVATSARDRFDGGAGAERSGEKAIVLYGDRVTLTGLRVTEYNVGLDSHAANATIEDSNFTDIGRIDGTEGAAIDAISGELNMRRVTILDSTHRGIHVNAATVHAAAMWLEGNSGAHGCPTSTVTVFIEHSWWGDATGPNAPDNPGGLGDVVLPTVDYTGYLGAPPY